MGSDWSWPCGDREKIRFKPSILKTKEIHNTDILNQVKSPTVQVTAITSTLLNQALKRPNSDYIPVSVCNHPIKIEESLIICQRHTNLKFFKDVHGHSYASEFSFIGKNSADSKQMLENDILNIIENGQVFLGIVGRSQRYFLAFFKPAAKIVTERKIKVFSIGEITKSSLESFLNQSTMCYRGFAYRKNDMMILMEENEKYIPQSTHMVIELFQRDLENIENAIADIIEEYLENSCSFIGSLSYRSKMFLIFLNKNYPF